jgi:hypothetical protein
MSEHLVESRHQTITAITDTLTGNITTALLATETVTINPLTGTKTYTLMTGLVRTADGNIVKPDAVNVCRSCQAIISTNATKHCTTCKVTLCASCAGTPEQCRHCWWKEQRRRFGKWLTKP